MPFSVCIFTFLLSVWACVGVICKSQQSWDSPDLWKASCARACTVCTRVRQFVVIDRDLGLGRDREFLGREPRQV